MFAQVTSTPGLFPGIVSARDAQSHFVGKTFGSSLGAVGRKSAMTEFRKNGFQRGNWITSVRVLGRSGSLNPMDATPRFIHVVDRPGLPVLLPNFSLYCQFLCNSWYLASYSRTLTPTLFVPANLCSGSGRQESPRQGGCHRNCLGHIPAWDRISGSTSRVPTSPEEFRGDFTATLCPRGFEGDAASGAAVGLCRFRGAAPWI